MGNFHRFVDPTYYLFGGESFPASPGGTGTVGTHTYDRVNVTSGGMGGPGGAANVDNQKGSGPNQYTYFVAFNEDGTSADANRGFRALAQNTDVLDDLLRTSVPKHATASLSAPGTDSVLLSGDVFVGDNVVPASVLVSVAHGTTGRRLYNGTTQVAVTDIDTGTPGVSVIGTGWYTNPTVRFNTPVSSPVLVTYGARTSNARIVEEEREALWRMFVQGLDTSVKAKSLEAHGFNEVYRRATGLSSLSVGAAVDTAGSGATILRDGQAFEVREPDQDYTTGPGRPDPYLALFKAAKSGSLGATADATRRGAVGFLDLVTSTISGIEAGDSGPSYAGFARLVRRNVDVDVAGSGATFTRIPLGAAAQLNPLGAGATRVKLTTAGHRFRTSGKTAVRLDVDLLLITRSSGERQLATITGFVDDVTVSTSLVTGSTSYPANEVVTVEWVQPNLLIGEGTAWGQGGLRYYARPLIGADATAAPGGRQAKIVAGSIWRNSGLSGEREDRALAWGGFDEDSGFDTATSYLMGDGGVQAKYYQGNRITPHTPITVAGATYTANFHPIGAAGITSSADTFHLRVTHAGATTITINMHDSLVPVLGSRLTVTMNVTSGTAVTMVWSGSSASAGSGFLFSGTDDQIPPYMAGWYKWEGVVVLNNGVYTCLMTRTDY
jgi:hypothetical protein